MARLGSEGVPMKRMVGLVHLQSMRDERDMETGEKSERGDTSKTIVNNTTTRIIAYFSMF